MTRAPLLAAFVLALFACGGRLEEANLGDSGGHDAVVDVPLGEGGVRCGLDDGTPLCAWPGCPAPGCDTCVAFTDRDYRDVPSRLPLSVCPSNAYKVVPEIRGHGVPCSACPNDDDLCAQMILSPICVHPPICSIWFSAGISGCYFRDMTAWSPTPIADLECPGVGFCGGTCGKCAEGETCTGRSPTHPIGVCTAISDHFYNVCKHVPRNSAEACPEDGSLATDQACLVFKNPKPEDQTAADKVGACVKKDLCLSAKALLPGGVFCVDGVGREL